MIAFWPNIGKRKQTAIVGLFENGKLTPSPWHLPRGARTAFPPGGRCHRAQRQINIVKLTHYPDHDSA